MDYLNSFLEQLCKNKEYGADRLDNLAEIYLGSEVIPSCLIELKKDVLYLKFRIGLSSIIVARLTHEISMLSTNLFIEDDFYIHPEYGYMYGDNARGEYIKAMQSHFHEQTEETEGAFFVSTTPIFACGRQDRYANISKSKG